MPVVVTCECCGLLSLGKNPCSKCQGEIRNGVRRGKLKLRQDCPLHPDKAVWCRTFGSVSHESKSRTCQIHHWQVISHQPTEKLLKMLEQFENAPGRISHKIMTA